MITYESFFRRLLEVVPEYQPLYDEDLAFFKELLPHVFLGNFVRFLDQAAGLDSQSLLERSLKYLDKAMQSNDARVVELVAVSFVENLLGTQSYHVIVRQMPDRLRDEVRRQRLDAEAMRTPRSGQKDKPAKRSGMKD